MITAETPAASAPLVTSPTANAFVATTTFIALALLLPLSLVRWERASIGTAAALAYLVVFYASLRLSSSLGKGIPELLNTGFWIFTYVFMGLALLTQIASQAFPEKQTYSDDVLIRSVLCILLGIVAYDVGRSAVSRNSRTNTFALTPQLDLRRSIALGLLGLAFTFLAVQRYGWRPFFTSRDALDAAIQGRPASVTENFIKAEDKAAGILMYYAVRLPAFVALYMVLLLIRSKGHRALTAANRLALVILVCALVMANAVVNNPISSSRFDVGLYGFAFASIFVNLRRVALFRASAVILIGLFVFAFSAMDAFRRTESRDFSRGGSPSEALVTQLDYGASQVAHEAVVYVNTNGHTLGRQILGTATFWLPRSVWAEKPIPTGPLVNRGFVRVGSSLWTEGFVDFGYVGVAVLLFLWGRATARLDNLYLEQKSTLVSALMPLLVASQFLLLRGALMAIVGPVSGLIALAAFCVTRGHPRLEGQSSLAQGTPVRH